MSVKVGVNGFGRDFLRCVLDLTEHVAKLL
jgi:hypothetical protein